jgi:hypothetical protein
MEMCSGAIWLKARKNKYEYFSENSGPKKREVF